MSNMPYCRFQNTKTDLADCVDGLEELFTEAEPLSARELEAARALVKKAIDLVRKVAEAANVAVDLDELEGKVDDCLNNANKEAKAREEDEADEAEEDEGQRGDLA